MDSLRSLGNFLNTRQFDVGTKSTAEIMSEDRKASAELHRLAEEQKDILLEALGAPEGTGAFVNLRV